MPTLRENVVILRSAEIEAVTPLANSAAVSQGQPSEWPPRVNHHMDVVSILFKAGRHKTQDIASHFNALSGGLGHEFAPQSGGGGTPKELNFCFGVSIKWKSGGETSVYLGQGNNGVRNNWWIGAPQITAGGNATIALPSGKSLTIAGVSAEDDIGTTFSGLTKGLPPQYQGLADLIGTPLVKELFQQVNLFRFTE